MPTTINGIGTHYYGKRDASSRIGTCRQCGAHVKLETYTTRLYFVVVFIPIIPLKRVRIMDHCPSCDRLYYIEPEKYEKSRQESVSTALQKYRDEPSVDSALEANALLLSFHMHKESDAFREAPLEEFPQSAELRAGLAMHLEQMGRTAEATPLYEQGFQLNPELPVIRNALGWRRTNENQLDEAYKLFDFLREPGAGLSYNLANLEMLGKAYQKQKEHERALEIFEHLLRELPSIGENNDFRKLVTKSEVASQRQVSILPQRSTSVMDFLSGRSGHLTPLMRVGIISSVLGTVFVGGMAWWNEHRRTHRTLHLINSFAQPIGVSIDGGPEKQVKLREPITLSEGKHRIAITGPVTKTEEIELQTNYWSRWNYFPVWIFNVEKLAFVAENTMEYAVVPQPPIVRWLRESEFHYIPHADFVFERPPQTMTLGKNGKSIKKIHLDLETLAPSTLFTSISANGDSAVAMTFAEGHLNRFSNDSTLLTLYVDYAERNDAEDRANQFLKAGLWKPTISVPWHRSYQSLKSNRSNFENMIAEYDAQLVMSPDNVSLLYLRGRIGRTRSDELKYFHLANKTNPNAAWPAYALAEDAAMRGDWREANQFLTIAKNELFREPSYRSLMHLTKIATGEAQTLVTKYQAEVNDLDYYISLTSVYLMADALASMQQFDEARRVTRNWLAQKGGPSANNDFLTTFDGMLNYVCGDLEAIRRGRDRLAKTTPREFHIHSLLAISEPDAAAELASENESLDEWKIPLSISLSYSIVGDQAKADVWLSRACQKLLDENSIRQRAANLLSKDLPPTDEDLAEVALLAKETPLFLAALARRFPQRAAEFNQRANQLNVGRLPPYLLVKQATETP